MEMGNKIIPTYYLEKVQGSRKDPPVKPGDLSKLRVRVVKVARVHTEFLRRESCTARALRRSAEGPINPSNTFGQKSVCL